MVVKEGMRIDSLRGEVEWVLLWLIAVATSLWMRGGMGGSVEGGLRASDCHR